MKFVNEGTWFCFDDDKPKEGRICLRTLSPNDIERIDRETVKTEKEYKRISRRDPLQRFEYLVTDTIKRQEMQWDALIVDWENLEDDKGPVECNTKNKIRMMGEYANFALFVGRCVEKLVADQPSFEDLEKNSPEPLNS